MAERQPAGTVRRSRAGRLHSPSRERILDYVQAAAAPVELAVIAEHCQVHENTARTHLEALLNDGYLVRSAGPALGRGRPPWLWSAPRREENPYAGLAMALARQISAGADEPTVQAQRAGRDWGRELARRYLPDPVQAREETAPAPDRAAPAPEVAAAVGTVLQATGFDPEPADGQGRIWLNACPMLEAAKHYPQVVCNVHLGIVRGVLAELGRDGAGASLNVFPRPGQCELLLGAPAERRA